MSGRPPRGRWFNRLLAALARGAFRLLGWRAQGPLPDPPRCVLLAAPHTSNWDGVFGYIAVLILTDGLRGVKAAGLAKDSLLRGPLGPVYRLIGGIAVDRSRRQGMVGRAAALFQKHDRLLFAVAPEGTRKWAPHWKSGFYHIARAAGVPIACFFIDYRRKVSGFGPTLVPSGDIEADMEVLRAFFSTVSPKFARNAGPMALAPGPTPGGRGG